MNEEIFNIAMAGLKAHVDSVKKELAIIESIVDALSSPPKKEGLMSPEQYFNSGAYVVVDSPVLPEVEMTSS